LPRDPSASSSVPMVAGAPTRQREVPWLARQDFGGCRGRADESVGAPTRQPRLLRLRALVWARLPGRDVLDSPRVDDTWSLPTWARRRRAYWVRHPELAGFTAASRSHQHRHDNQDSPAWPQWLGVRVWLLMASVCSAACALGLRPTRA
jgi:hypothetical protein